MENPFIDADEEGEVASVAYRYRRWDLGNNLVLVCRCELDAVQQVILLSLQNETLMFISDRVQETRFSLSI